MMVVYIIKINLKIQATAKKQTHRRSPEKLVAFNQFVGINILTFCRFFGIFSSFDLKKRTSKQMKQKKTIKLKRIMSFDCRYFVHLKLIAYHTKSLLIFNQWILWLTSLLCPLVGSLAIAFCWSFFFGSLAMWPYVCDGVSHINKAVRFYFYQNDDKCH